METEPPSPTLANQSDHSPAIAVAVGTYVALLVLSQLPMVVRWDEALAGGVVTGAVNVVGALATVALFSAAFVIRRWWALLLPLFAVAVFALSVPGPLECVAIVESSAECDLEFFWRSISNYAVPVYWAIAFVGVMLGKRFPHGPYAVDSQK